MANAFSPHVLIAIGGTMKNSPEIWGTQVRAYGYANSQAENQAFCDGALLSDVTTLLENSEMAFTNEVELGYVKANAIQADGTYRDAITAVHFVTDGSIHGTAAPTWPYQVSVVVSLRAAGRGPGTHGRMYLPSQSVSGVTGGQMSEIATANIATVMADFLVALNTDSDGAYIPALFSAKGQIGSISSVEVGSVPDTQRRRRNALVETYAKATITP